ncbi:hypothetical protein [Paracoccus sp. (in: a-proteobacteria)]|uniref:hypothetical protein n=1 Tax=Paracoccus sp. TaxID=267 RepID=UPI0035B2E745
MGKDLRHAPHWVVFCLTYMAAIVVAFIVGNLASFFLYRPDEIGSYADVTRSFLHDLYLAGIAGLATFQAIFGRVTGRWRGWRFWVIGPALLYGAGKLSANWLASGHLSYLDAATNFLVPPFVLGLLFLQLGRN